MTLLRFFADRCNAPPRTHHAEVHGTHGTHMHSLTSAVVPDALMSRATLGMGGPSNAVITLTCASCCAGWLMRLRWLAGDEETWTASSSSGSVSRVGTKTSDAMCVGQRHRNCGKCKGERTLCERADVADCGWRTARGTYDMHRDGKIWIVAQARWKLASVKHWHMWSALFVGFSEASRLEPQERSQTPIIAVLGCRPRQDMD